MGWKHEVISSSLLFILVFGMSATVDINHLKAQLRNRKAICTGIFTQFIILPFFGFAVVQALDLDSALGITLLVITSSPGGSYSNWWCSMFNADLALSVTMTAVSTSVSILMLPINLIMYATNIYEGDVVNSVDWPSLFIALAIVISSIGLGLFCSAHIHSHRFNLFANKIGNLAGLSLVIFSVVVSHSTNSHEKLWKKDWKFYVGIACPCVFGLLTANIIATFMRLKKPERVTVSVESCYQNIGIATSVAINMFQGDQLAEAVAVPLYYGLVEAVTLGIYCLIAWKIGWTKAPSDESFCVILTSTYEVEKSQHLMEMQSGNIDAVEVVLGSNMKHDNDGFPCDLVFELDTSSESCTALENGNCILGVSYPASPRKSTFSSPKLTERKVITSEIGEEQVHNFTQTALTPSSDSDDDFSQHEFHNNHRNGPLSHEPSSKITSTNTINNEHENNGECRRPNIKKKLGVTIMKRAISSVSNNSEKNGRYKVSPTDEDEFYDDPDSFQHLEGQVIAGIKIV